MRAVGRALRRVWLAIWAVLGTNLTLAALFGMAAIGTISDPMARGRLTWKSTLLGVAATCWLAQALKYLKAYLWEGMRFELVRPGDSEGGGGGVGGGKKPETAAPRLPKTKDEVRCN